MLNYHDLSNDQFEKVIVALGQRLFGAGLYGFAEGKDGGKDAKFHGTAECYPSKSSPWEGCTIIQAKHTNGINASFSDKAFFNAAENSGILVDELPRVNQMIAAGELHNYLVVSNRKLTGLTEGKLKNYINETTGIELSKVGFVGSDQLDHWFNLFPEAKDCLNFNPLDRPLIISPHDLAETIEAFREIFKQEAVETQDLPVPRTEMAIKNPLNNMSESFAKKLRSLYMPITRQIDIFLRDPKNSSYLESYHDAAEEFSLKIIEFQKPGDTFDSVFNYLTDMLVDRSPILKTNKRLTRAMLFYMYWKCDIGKNQDD